MRACARACARAYVHRAHAPALGLAGGLWSVRRLSIGISRGEEQARGGMSAGKPLTKGAGKPLTKGLLGHLLKR